MLAVDSIFIVNEPILDGNGNSRIADNLMSEINRQLTGYKRWVQSVVIFEDFQQIMTLFFLSLHSANRKAIFLMTFRENMDLLVANRHDF